jgi:starch synthase
MADQSLLGLSSKFLSSNGLEYHGHLSMMKAGLKFADRITTVSPTYAREISTDAYGAGLDGVIRSRGQDVSGILNGIDQRVWNPSTDTALAQTFDGDDVRGKAVCKQALQAEFQLEQSARAMVLIAISRLTSQKGLDLLLQAWPKIQSWGLQLVVQGTGDKDLEAGFRDLADRYPGQVAVHIGYDEERAHRLMAGGDALVVPSRFEPCGLTQLYAMRYGTLPIVRATGGLADTVVDLVADPEHATGFQFRDATVDDLVHAIHRAHEAWHQRTVRQRLIANAMRQDFSWDQPARDYLQLYETVLSR